MSNVEKNAKAAPARSGKTKWIVLVLILLLGVFAVKLLPHGYSDDLARVGKGMPTLVLIRDKNAVQSYELMDIMDSVRGQYEGKVEFLLSDYGMTETTIFMQTYQADRASLVMLDGAGKLVKVIHAPQTKESLKQEIADGLGVK